MVCVLTKKLETKKGLSQRLFCNSHFDLLFLRLDLVVLLLVFCAVWFSWFIPTAVGIFAEVNETAGSFVHVCFTAAVSGLSIFFLILVIRDIRRVYRIIRNME